MSTDLHTQIRAKVERRLAIARAATPGPWGRYGNLGYAVFTEAVYDDPDYDPPAVTLGSVVEADAEHIALHDPADAIRRYEYALKVLARHRLLEPDAGQHVCEECGYLGVLTHPAACDDIADLATSLGLEATDV